MGNRWWFWWALCFCLASEPVGKLQGCYVLLLAPEAKINYLFTLMHLEAATLWGGEGGGGEITESKKKLWEKEECEDNAHLFIPIVRGLEKRVTAHKWALPFSFREHKVKYFISFDSNYTADEWSWESLWNLNNGLNEVISMDDVCVWHTA